MNILITSGGTEEKIDQVRRITNTSSGRTGYHIGQKLIDEGHNIYYLHSQKSKALDSAAYNCTFVTSRDLEHEITKILNSQHIDIVIQCAAVSDFIVDKIVINGELFEPASVNKINSRDSVELVLKSQPKIITKIKHLSSRSTPIVIGFKLTNTSDQAERREAALKLSLHPDIDFIIHNDLSEITESSHPTEIYFKDKVLFSGKTKDNLSENLIQLIQSFKEAFTYDLMS